MQVWFALLLTPLIALVDLTAAFALATPGCETQRGTWLHLLPLAALVAVLWLSALAARETRRLDGVVAGGHGPGEVSLERRLMMARAATRIGLLSALVVVAMWIPQWLLSPCLA